MNILKINGQALEGIYVDAAISFNKPAKRVSTYSVPGRNGDLVIDEGTFDNVLITYPVFEKSTFPTEFDAIVNYLASLEGYQRIECSNDPQHYRLGRFVVPQNPTAKRLNRDGYWQISFDCKPQRWTLDGEEETEIDNTMVVIASDDTPYLFRKAGGAEDITGADRATLSALTGASVGWNQYMQPSAIPSTRTIKDVTFTNNGDGSFTTSGTASGAIGGTDYFIIASTTLVSGHKYLLKGCPSGGSVSTYYAYDGYPHYDNGNGYLGELNLPRFYVSIASGVNVTGLTWKPQLTDLTLAFGSAIADAAYAKEQSEAGSGIAWLKSAGLFTKSYYPYDAGSIVSVNTEGRKVVGFNQWDEETEAGYINASGGLVSDAISLRSKNYCACAPSTQYYFHKGANINTPNICWYDANKTFISRTSVATPPIYTSPSNAAYFKLTMYGYGSTYNHDVCINISKATGEPKNGDYVPYTTTTYPIPSTDLRGITKLSDGKITYDGDTFLPNGTINRKYGIVDLGTLNWNGTAPNFYAPMLAYKRSLDTNFVCAKYVNEGVSTASPWYGSNMSIKYFYNASNPVYEIYIRDEAFSSVVTFKTAMSGVYLVYELATPTTEDEQEWQGVELVYPEGTEEFIDERTVPFAVGHDTDYFNHIGYVINNPTHFTSKPLIRVYGDGTFTVNNTTVIIAAHTEPYIDIDCELQECFYEDTNMNSYVSFSDNDFPELIPGANGFMPTPGITKLVVTPRWWIL